MLNRLRSFSSLCRRALPLVGLLSFCSSPSEAQVVSGLGLGLRKLMQVHGINGQRLGNSAAGLGDINKDGKADFAVSNISFWPSRTDTCFIYFGGKGVLDSIPDIILEGGGNQICPGDFNADGNRDLVLSGWGYDSTIRKTLSLIRYYPGEKNPPYFPSQPSRIWVDTTDFGHEDRLAVGDLDCDGYQDLAIYTSSYYSATQRRVDNVTLYFGGEKPFERSVRYQYGYNRNPADTSWCSYGFKFLIGDIDGDGCGDLLLLNRRAWGNFPSMAEDYYLEVHYGKKGLAQKDTIPDAVFFSEDYPFLYQENQYKGGIGLVDLNGDKIADLAFFQSDSLWAFRLGSRSRPVTLDSLVTISNPRPDEYRFWPIIHMTGDMNGDGYDDLTINMGYRVPGPSVLYINYLCGPHWYTKPAYNYLDIGEKANDVHSSWCGIGDQNGDGGSEILLPRSFGDNAEQGDFKIIASDTSLALAVEREPPVDPAIRFEVYPNPSGHRILLEYNLKKNHAVPAHILLFDTFGNRRLDRSDAALIPGTHILTLEGASLPAGVYLLRIETTGRSFHRKVLIMR